jgi:hypothetical protein
MAITPLPTPPSRSRPSTFSDEGDAFLAALPVFVSEANAQAAALTLNATTDTSTSSNAIGTGAKTFTVTAGKSFQPGMWLVIADTAAPSTNAMYGTITSYGGTTLVMNVVNIIGSGTKTAWTISQSAPGGGMMSNLVEDTTPQLGGDLDLNGKQITAHRADHWTKTTGTFTATPASTSTLTMTTDLTAPIKVGMGLQYVIGGTTYFGQVSAIASDLLTVRGAPLGGDVTALYYGGGTVRQVVVIIPGTYEDASNTALITSDLKSNLVWTLPLSYLVHFSVYSNVHDSGATHGQASVRINAAEVNTTAGGELIAANTTWYPTAVNIAVAAYDINPGELLEVTSVKGSTGDASDLTVIMIFVTP